MQSTKSTADTLYTVEFTFHSATNVPIADLPGFTSDPFVACLLAVPAHPNHNADNPLVFRSRTVRGTLNPTWESTWRVAGIPCSGFKLTIRLCDEDPGDHDDRLGTVVVREDHIHENLFRDHQEFNVKKTRGSVRSYVLTYIASAVSKRVSVHARLYLSIKVIGKTINQVDRRVYTVGPHWWSVHYSPLFGKLTGTHQPGAQGNSDPNKPTKIVTTFQANKLQLGGPVPAELRHHFVGYRPFIDWLFAQKGLRGRMLNFGLRRQYSMVYYYSRSTEYGVIDNLDTETSHGEVKSVGKSSRQKEKEESIQAQLATRFLEMTQWGEGGRLYTYVITLDGEWRFTETGPEFAINMLSKHSMHSNVTPDIAFSGEFFVQKLTVGTAGADNPHGATTGKETRESGDSSEEGKPTNAAHVRGGDISSTAQPLVEITRESGDGHLPSSAVDSRPSTSSEVPRSTVGDPRDPGHYELVIDNSSGTYRPKKELLPVLEGWLGGPTCLGGLGKVRAMDCFSGELKDMKENRTQIKAEAKTRRGEPQRPVYVQKKSSLSSEQMRRIGLARSGSLSSSDMDDIVDAARRFEREAAGEENGSGDDITKDKKGKLKQAEGKVGLGHGAQ